MGYVTEMRFGVSIPDTDFFAHLLVTYRYLSDRSVGPVRSGTHMTSPLGRPIRRREDAALLTGCGRFVDDLNVPGAVYLAFARSPYAKARIVGIDTTAARNSAGVNL